jgi:AGZA family xanthine/uracil permease-like MFS transporter
MKGALIAGIACTTVAAGAIGRIWGQEQVVVWKGFFAAPDFSVIFQLDFLASLKLAMWPVVFAFLFTDMFDSLSTFVGIAEAGNVKDDNGEPRNIKQSLTVDGLATCMAGLLGSSPGTSYIESATGIEEGGRTGLTAVVAGLLFLPFMFLSPLLSVVPAIATAPALVLVGVFMMKPVTSINWTAFDDAIPAFLALVLIPTTYSITQGIIWGFLSWTIIKIVIGKRDAVTPTLLVIDGFAVLSLVI